MSKLLTKGDGKKQWTSVIIYIVAMLAGIIGSFILLSKADGLRSGDEKTMIETMAWIIMIIGVFSIFPVLKNSFAARTNIKVYEDKIEGDALEGAFPLKNFKLSYSQLTNVDVVRNTAILLYTSHTKYTCYASNAMEIQEIISKRIVLCP